ncbi:DUF3604 domain-containing protein [Tropicimonas sp. IMCC6043]|uniref:DUF3604 domain-containing protein n=1 Tax=Tropicimonas sp. IMCC6043 TaxID=2510645 RepID=UPI00101C8750|nr:DUF3604 domain-containing protein [Tropicimonas sp. IMCC6043]RYH07185.1 DUF3604 domain-containing protein [Tropicimonas sp. IMCC6043]
MKRATIKAVLLSGTALFVCQEAAAQELVGLAPDPDVEYSPYITHDYPNQVFFGDTHLHTAYSADAGLVGATTSPDDAYRFAKGETVTSSNGLEARLQRPLDFLVVADHAENLGLYIALDEENEEVLANDWGRGLYEVFAPRTDRAMAEAYLYWAGAFAFAEEGAGDPLADTSLQQTMWQRVTEAAERHNQPGAFSAFIGFEWSTAPDGNNLHRVIMMRDGKDEADTVVPFSSYDSEDPEDLWDWMERYEEATGGQLLAIPHNGNLSNGLMFDDETFDGDPLDAAYAERRMQWEPVYEVTQMKGDGEAHPMLSPEDAFADYGTWDTGSFGPELKTPEMLPREYAREALKRGLAYEDALGANPFKFGMIGSTDSHTALATTTEDNFFGKVSMVEPTADPVRFEEQITGRATPDDPSDDIVHAQALAAGLAAVWARENTRESIWDAFARKEVFATTGTRIRVRVFAGTDFVAEDLERSDFAAHGYKAGVPMGGDLSGLSDAPKLLIRALRDPDGANLDRVQVVKGWVDANGETQERVYDVACSDGRAIVEGECDGPVGNTVDIASATYSNSIGEPFLEAFWVDPEFDPTLRAFYYVRVLEIPTPRWTTYDAAYFGIALPEGIEPTHQERAYTSPIWVKPAS